MYTPPPQCRIRHFSSTVKNRALAIAGLAFIASAAVAQETHVTWSDYLGGSDSSHYSALKQINRSNLDKLQVAWTYPTGDSARYVFSPIAVGNVMYVLAKGGSLVAIDATDGKEIWVHQFVPPPGSPGRGGAGGRGNRGLNYWESKDRSGIGAS